MRDSVPTLIGRLPRWTLYVNTADGSTVSNPGAGVATTLSLNYTLPKDWFVVERTLAITFEAAIKGAATNNTRFRLMGGSAGTTALCDLTARANAGTGQAQTRIVFFLTCRSVGSSGSVLITVPEFFQANAVFSQVFTLATVDTTVANILALEYMPSVTNGNIECIPKQMLVEAVNW